MQRFLVMLVTISLVIFAHLVWFAIQGMFFVVDPPSPDENQMGFDARMLLTVYWAILGYGLLRALTGWSDRPTQMYIAAPIILTTVFVMLHLFVGKNELTGAVMTTWFIPLGYFLGGAAYFVAHRKKTRMAT